MFLSERKLGQWRRKWDVFSTLQPRVQSRFNVSWKLFLNLCSWRWLSPSLRLIKYLIPFRFCKLNMFFGVGLLNFKILFLKILRLGAFWISGSSFIPFHDNWRKKSIFEEAVFNFEMRNIISVPCKVWPCQLRNYIKKIFWRLVFQSFIKLA